MSFFGEGGTVLADASSTTNKDEGERWPPQYSILFQPYRIEHWHRLQCHTLGGSNGLRLLCGRHKRVRPTNLRQSVSPRTNMPPCQTTQRLGRVRGTRVCRVQRNLELRSTGSTRTRPLAWDQSSANCYDAVATFDLASTIDPSPLVALTDKTPLRIIPAHIESHGDGDRRWDCGGNNFG